MKSPRSSGRASLAVLLFAVVYLPLEEFLLKWAPGGSTGYAVARLGFEGLLYAAVGALAAARVARGLRPRATPLDVPLVLFLGLASCSLFLSDGSWLRGLINLRVLLRYVAAFYLVVYLELAPAERRVLLKLVLVSANPFGWSEEVQTISAQENELFEAGRFDEAAELMVRAWVDGPQRGPDEVPSELRDRVRAMQRRAYELQAGVDASLRRVEIQPARISVPTLVVRGALDWPDVARAAARFVTEIPDAREVVIEDSAHLPALERPDELARIVLEFLDQ